MGKSDMHSSRAINYPSCFYNHIHLIAITPNRGISCNDGGGHTRRHRWREGIVFAPRGGGSFENAVVGIEAVLKALGVLVGGMLGQHFAGGGALERLEARLALDGEGSGVLGDVSMWNEYPDSDCQGYAPT